MKTLLISAFLALLFGAGGAFAQSCNGSCWGAVGIGPGGATGYSYGWGYEDDAYNSAAEGCGYNCTEIRTFQGACGAMAKAPNGGWGWAVERTRALAESSAMSYCMDHGRNCRVQVWACSG